MLTNSAISLAGKVFTFLGQTVTTGRNQKFELKKENSRLEIEASSKHNNLVRERLEEAHIILSEISREFFLTFLTIDWSNSMSPKEFHNKYRDLCVKLDRVKMTADLYVSSITESVDELSSLMNHYWGNFHIVLIKEERGEKVDHTTPSYSEAVGYAQKIPPKVYHIQAKIAKMVDSLL